MLAGLVVCCLGTLPVGLAGVLAAPAAADETNHDTTAAAPVLRWEVSQQFDDHLSSHALGGGATEDSDGVVTFPGGTGTYDPSTGVAEVAYQGSVRGAFQLGQEFYHVRIAEPVLQVDGSGRGEMTALVSAANIAAQGEEAQETQPARVVMFGFDVGASDWAPDGALASLSATPDWAGVVEPGSEDAAELGMDEGTPIDGRAWAVPFLHQVTSGVRAHFYATGSGSDDKKRPAAFVAQATPTDVVPEPEPPAPLTLDWAVSSEFTDVFDRSLTGGATETDGVITFPDGRGSHDEATGVTTVSYAGSVTGSVPDPFLGISTRYSLTLADPRLQVDGTGAGQVTAVVSGETPSPLSPVLPILPGTSTTPTRVVVATFSVTAEDWSASDGVATLATTPDWATVGRSFPAAFLDQVTAESRDHFRATSEDAAQDAKAPAPLTARGVHVPAPEPEPEPGPEPEACEPAPASPSVSVSRLDTTSGDTFRVLGTGFRAESCPGDSGVYVGIAEGDVLPDVAERENTEQFLAVDWVRPGRIVDGAFTSTLSLPDGAPEGTASVFTWQAHTHSNTSQDTVTALPRAAAEPAPTTTTLRVLKKPRAGERGAMRILVTADGAPASGRVALTVRQSGRVETHRATLRSGGKVKLRLDRASEGRLVAIATYEGDEDHDRSEGRVRFRVR